MALHLSLNLYRLSSHSKSITTHNKPRKKVNAIQVNGFNFARKNALLGLLFGGCTSQSQPSSWSTLSLASSSSEAFAQTDCGRSSGIEPENRVDRLVWALHESARSFSMDVESLGLIGSGPQLAMAWVGKDVHGWHKRISYMVVVYVLLKTAIEVEALLSHDRNFNNASPVKEILSPKIDLIGNYIENQLKTRHSELGDWFRVTEPPPTLVSFIPLLKNWSIEYAGSGIAGMVVAMSCCVAVGKLGSGRITCPSCTFSIDDVMVEFMDRSHSLVPVEKLHQLSIEAGFEFDFLTHFGRKVFLSKKSEELEFWIGLAQKKLSSAFQKETIISGAQTFPDKVQANTLATLGLFAYLGRRTRLFLSRMGIKDLDEPVKDLLSYMECGGIFIYPEFSYISMYQSFMEVVIDEIGWLDFYWPFQSTANHERRRSKQHAVQAETEIVLSTVFTVCYDVFAGFAHFNRSTQQLLDTNLLKFLLQSQNLLANCLEDYWAVYGKSSGEFLKIMETSAHDNMKTRGTIKTIVRTDPEQNPISEITIEHPRENSAATTEEAKNVTEKENPIHESLLKKYTIKLVSVSSDIWMGTQLLCVDITMALELIFKQLRGYQVTRRETQKLHQTLNDIGSLIPVTILMLLPVSAVGHAAILAAIKKYMPSMIPSPYSSDRLNMVKQLERTKKMEVRLKSNYDDSSSELS